MQRRVHGRASELGMLDEGLAQVHAGGSRAFALVGEPGIGKTRLAADIVRRAAAAGFATAWGGAWEAGGAPAYWPWRVLFESLPRLATAPLARLLGKQAPGAAQPADPDLARFELFDAVAVALQAASAERPLLFVLEDLHAADLPSLELADFCTRRLRSSRVAWVLTWRDAEAARSPVRDSLARIAREVTVLPLRRLSAEESAALVDELAGAPSGALAGQLFLATAGNPLFLVETLACLAARGPSVLPAGLERLPIAQGVAAVVRERLAPLSPAARRALEAAAILGGRVQLSRWARSADTPEDLLLGRAAEIVATGVLVELAPDRWAFSHDLVREAIARDLAPSQVQALHARIALGLDALVREGDARLVGERAHHGVLALGALPAAEVIAWAVAASEQARAQCAYEEAVAVLERTVAALGSDAQVHGPLQLALGRARTDQGDLAAAREALTLTMQIARAGGDAVTFAEAVLALGSRYVFGDIRDELIGLIDEASGTLGEAHPALQARLLARKAAALTPAARPAEALQMARRALALVQGSGDVGSRLEVAVAAGAAFGDFAHTRERIPVNEEVVRLARAAGDRALELRGLSRLVTDHLAAGDFSRADRLLPERDALASSLRLPRFTWVAPLFRSMRAMPAGRFAVCDAAIEEAQVAAGHLGDPNALRCIAVHRAWLFLAADRLDALRAHLPAFEAALAAMPPFIPSVVRAVLATRAGALQTARAEVAAIDPGLSHAAPTPMAALAEAVAEVGPPALARGLVDALTPHGDTFASWGLFGLVVAPPISASVGLLEASLGEAVDARRHFEQALERTTAVAAGAHRAWVRWWYGRALLGPLGDAAAGRAMLEAAAAEAAALCMPSLATRCQALLAGAQADPAAPASDPPALVWSMRPQAGAWLVQAPGRSFLVPPLRGMPMLARLAAHPHQEIHALALVAAGDEEGELPDNGDAGELLDAKARAAYRRRFVALTEEVEEAEARGDAGRARSLAGELETLRRELSRAVGRGGRVRRAGVAAERARVTAQRRIREAIKRIAEVDAELGAWLDRTIRTGAFCAYRPDMRT